MYTVVVLLVLVLEDTLEIAEDSPDVLKCSIFVGLRNDSE